MASPSCLLSGAGTSCSHGPAIKHPSFVSGRCPLRTSTCPRPSCPPARRQLPPEFYLRMGLFQNPTLQRPLQLGPVPTLRGRVSLSKGPRKRSCDCAAAEVQTTANQAPCFTALWHLSPNTSKRVCPPGSTGTFAHGEAVWPLPNALQAGEPLLPVSPTDPSDPAACSWAFTPLPHRSTVRHRTQELQAPLHCLYKPGGIETHSFLPIGGFGEQVSC